MPIIDNITFDPPFFLRNKHLQTIVPGKFRKTSTILYQRERIKTYDDDFLDIDWSRNDSRYCAMVIHGMEGHSQRPYIKGIIKALNRNKWDCVALNLRGCSEVPNRLAKFYTAGSTEDLDSLVTHINNNNNYHALALIGFSLGGNLVLKYLGEKKFDLPSNICCSAAISAPCDLNATSEAIDSPKNRLYLNYFLKKFERKIKTKMKLMPGEIDAEPLKHIHSLSEYDNQYTAPLHGYKNASEYYKKCSCKQFIETIEHPSLLISSLDDPFFNESCYPHKEAGLNKNFFLMTPNYGGHMGFWGRGINKYFWHEHQVLTFLSQHIRTQ